MNDLGIGLIGCGNISAAYLRLAPMFRGLRLVAVADISMGAAQARAAEFDVRADSVESLLAADDINLIVNLTIPDAHFDVSRKALEAGKHVYSEKPYVLSVEEADTLSELAVRNGLRIGSAPDTFLGGAHQTARHLIDADAVGSITGGTCHVMSFGMEHWHPNPDFFFRPGGGPILDLGPYYITNLVQLIGPVRAVTAMSGAASETRTISNGPRDGEQIPVLTPTTIHAVLEFASGALVTLGASWDVKAHRHGEMELYGQNGSIYVPDPNFFGGEVVIARQDGTEQAHSADQHPFGSPNMTDGGGREQANYRCAGLSDMAVAIQENRQHRCNAEIARHVIEVMTGILAAGETRSWIEMRTSCDRPAYLGADEAASLLL